MKHVMLDLETLGTIPGSAVISIGAAQFDLDGNVGRTFKQNITVTSCREIGLIEDPATHKWWAELLIDRKPVVEAASLFHAWFQSCNAEFIWGNGATFDVSLWEAVCRKIGIQAPWKFWNVRDMRTVMHICDFDVRTMNRVGVHHDALDDVKFQIACVVRALQKFRTPPTSTAAVFA